MRVRSLFVPAALCAAALAAGCGRSTPDAKSVNPETAPDNENVDVGAPLYAVKPPVKMQLPPMTGREPLAVPNCTVQYEDRQQVSSEVDGTIELLAVRDDNIAATDVNLTYHPRDLLAVKRIQVPGQAGLVYDPQELAKLTKYRKLREGDTVKYGQVICLLDDQLIAAKRESASESKKAASKVSESATEGVKLTLEKLELTKAAQGNGGGSRGDVLQDQITLTRFQENLAQAMQTIAKATADFTEAEVMLQKHRIRSQVNGVVRGLSKRQGEFVKAGEKILEIQATDRVRLEGLLDVQYAGLVRRGLQVAVEPAIPSAPEKTLPLHRAAVTGLAVSSHADRPLVVTVSADGSGRAWDATTPNGAAHPLAHPVPVRSVACSPAGVPAVAVTGADDGKLRVFDVSKPNAIPGEG
jgi:WD40 repeat protein